MAEAFQKAKEGKVYEADPQIIIRHLPNLKQIAQDHIKGYEAESPRGVWVFGNAGSGKSYWARHAFEEYGEAYLKSQSKWWDLYSG